LIRTPFLSSDQYALVKTALVINGAQFEEKRFDSIGPSIGSELQTRSVYAIILVILAIALFIAFAFRHVSKPVSSWKRAVVEMARLQQASRAQADEEARLSRYVAEASKLRQEETKKFNDAAREASAQTAKFTQESQRLARESEALAKSIESTRVETEKLSRANDEHVDALHKSSSKLGLLTADIGSLGDKIKDVIKDGGSMAVSRPSFELDLCRASTCSSLARESFSVSTRVDSINFASASDSRARRCDSCVNFAVCADASRAASLNFLVSSWRSFDASATYRERRASSSACAREACCSRAISTTARFQLDTGFDT
jgi:hypothetical protein